MAMAVLAATASSAATASVATAAATAMTVTPTSSVRLMQQMPAAPAMGASFAIAKRAISDVELQRCHLHRRELSAEKAVRYGWQDLAFVVSWCEHQRGPFAVAAARCRGLVWMRKLLMIALPRALDSRCG